MPVNPAAALAIQVAKGILSMGWAFWSVDHVKQSHSGGPPPLTIKMSWPGVVNCQPECSQFGSIWDGLTQDFRAATGVERVPAALPVKKPDKEWFVRTHRDPAYQFPTGVIEIREGKHESGFYVVDKGLWDVLASEPTFSYRMLFLATNRQGAQFLWPVRLPRPDGRIDSW